MEDKKISLTSLFYILPFIFCSIMEIITIDGVRFISVADLFASGCVHAFGTRDLGAGASPAHARIKAAFPGVRELATVRQAHGKRVVRLRREEEVAGRRRVHGDIIIASAPGIAAAVRTADCAPILIYDPITKVVAAVHAGWRGTIARAAEEAVRVLESEYRAKARDLRAGIGPCIGPCHYQVDEPVIQGMRRALGERADEVLLPDPGDRARLDLSLANRIILEQAGVLPHGIHEVRACTYCHPELFYSYRRQGPGVPSLYHFILALF